MKFLKNAVQEAKKMPKAAWIAAVILPGGFTAVGAYLAFKSLRKKEDPKSLKEFIKEIKEEHDKG